MGYPRRQALIADDEALVLDRPFDLGAIVDIARRAQGRTLEARAPLRSSPDAAALPSEGPGARS